MGGYTGEGSQPLAGQADPQRVAAGPRGQYPGPWGTGTPNFQNGKRQGQGGEELMSPAYPALAPTNVTGCPGGLGKPLGIHNTFHDELPSLIIVEVLILPP